MNEQQDKLDVQQVIDELSKIIGAKEFIISRQNILIMNLQAQLKNISENISKKKDENDG